MLRLGLFIALVAGCLGMTVHEGRRHPVRDTMPELPPGVHFGEETDLASLREEILEDKARLDQLKVLAIAAMRENDQVTLDGLQEEVILIFQDLQYKWDFLSQVMGITYSLEMGLVHIAEKWHLYDPAENGTPITDSLAIPEFPAPELTQVETDNPIDPNMISTASETSSETSSENSMENSMESKEAESVGSDSEVREIDLKLLRKALKYWDQIKSGVQTINDVNTEEVEVAKKVACSQVPRTNAAINLVLGLKTSSDNGASCSGRVKTKASDVKSAISRFHTMAGAVRTVKNGVTGLDSVLLPLSRMPYVGGAASVVKNLLTPMKTTLSNIEPKTTRADRKMYPVWKNRMETLRRNADNAEKKFKKASKKCDALSRYLTAGRDCVCWMNAGTVKTNTINTIESGLGNAWHGGVLTTTANGYNTVTSVCNQWDNALNSIINAMSLPGIDNIYNPLNGLLTSLGPLFDIFGEINVALNYRLCMPNPIEATREAGERALEWTRERGREVANVFTGWRRKRSVFLAKKESHDFLTNGLVRSTRASDICFSVQQLIDGVNGVFNFLLGWAQDIIDAILSQINFSIPGLPNFNLININFLDGFNLPNIDLNFNLDFDLPFLRLPVPNFPNIPGLRLSLPDFTVPSFNLNWNPPSFSIPQHVCQPIGKK